MRYRNEKADPELVRVLDFFDQPRSESAATEYLVGLGYPRRSLKKFVEKHLLVRIDVRNAGTVAGSLKKIWILPDCAPILEQKLSWGLAVRRHDNTDGFSQQVIPNELAEALFGQLARVDVPTVIRRLTKNSEAQAETVQWFVVSELPKLLHLGYVHLDWV
jgi:hypothetical protein